MKSNYYLPVMCCALLAVSCQEEEMGFTQEEIFRGAYERSFVEKFGNIDPYQTWDFSPYGRRHSHNSALTRADEGTSYPENYVPIEGWADEATSTPNTYYEVPSALFAWMNENILTDGQDGNHTDLITGNFSFLWQTGQVLEIIPVWQGAWGQIYSLSVVMGDKESVVWYRNDGMQVKTRKNGKWVDISTTDNCTYTDGNTYERGCTTSSTAAIRAKPIIVTDDMLKKMGIENSDQQELKLKLNITTGMAGNGASTQYSCSGDYAVSTGEVYCCNNHPTGTQTRIGLIDIPDASLSVPEGYQKWLLGCEDTMHLPDDIDWDYNDVVFLIAGKVIEPVKTEETREEEIVIEKRYMIEDLTGYADFDFNDIVVDLKETYTSKYTISSDGVITRNDNTKYYRKQEAKIAHLCGTVPIQVKIGDSALPMITNPVDREQTIKELKKEDLEGDAKTWWENPGEVGQGWSPNVVFSYVGEKCVWNADENNISVIVWTKKDNYTETDYAPWVATFPEAGQVPYIIATEVSREWLGEGVNATQEWWNSLYNNTAN